MKSNKQLGGNKRRHVDVKIMGQKFTMMSDESEEHLFRVADYLNKKIEQIQSKTSTVGVSNLAILAALNIADDYLSSKGKLEKTKKQVRNRGKKLVQFLDSYIK